MVERGKRGTIARDQREKSGWRNRKDQKPDLYFAAIDRICNFVTLGTL